MENGDPDLEIRWSSCGLGHGHCIRYEIRLFLEKLIIITVSCMNCIYLSIFLCSLFFKALYLCFVHDVIFVYMICNSFAFTTKYNNLLVVSVGLLIVHSSFEVEKTNKYKEYRQCSDPKSTRILFFLFMYCIFLIRLLTF